MSFFVRFLHDQTIIHRSLSLNSILLNKREGVIKISDFELTKRLSGSMEPLILTEDQGRYLSPVLLKQAIFAKGRVHLGDRDSK